MTPQEEEQWNKDGAIDIDNKGLTKYDDSKESDEHTSHEININTSSEDKDEEKSGEDESKMVQWCQKAKWRLSVVCYPWNVKKQRVVK